MKIFEISEQKTPNSFTMNKKIGTLYDECLYYARDLDMESNFVDGMNKHKDAPKSVYYTYLKAHSTELKNLVRLDVDSYYRKYHAEKQRKKLQTDFLPIQKSRQ